MRIIKYRENILSGYETYIDIGTCEKHYDFLPLYEDELISYEDWYSDFVNNPIGIQMLTLHYYLLQFNSNNYVPEPLYKKIVDNKTFFNEFNGQWFEEDAPFFKGLDLNWDDIEDEILEEVKNENDMVVEVRFKNGSSLCFFDNDNTIQSFYVKEKDFENLQKTLKNIIEKLN